MMTMSVSTGPMIKAINNYIWPELSNNPYYITHNLILIPKFKGLLRIFGIAKIICTGKKLAAAVNLPGCQQLFRTNYTQQLTHLRSYNILPAIPARHGQIGYPCPLYVGQIRDHSRILIIGMRSNIEY